MGWYNSAWGYRKKITIDHDKVGLTQILTTNANSGQKEVTVQNGSKFTATDNVVIKDSANRETNTIASIAGNILTMTTNLANEYTTANGAWIKNGTLSAASFTNYPIIVKIASDVDLLSKASPSSRDVVFTNSNGETKLKHELDQILNDVSVTSSLSEVTAYLQGITCDATKLYASAAGSGHPGTIIKMDKDGTNKITHVLSTGSDNVYHISSLCIDGDYLYLVDFKNWSAGQQYQNAQGQVVRFTKSDLQPTGNKWDLKDESDNWIPWPEGLAKWDGYWWVVVHPDSKLYKFNSSWVCQKTYDIKGHGASEGYSGGGEGDCLNGYQGVSVWEKDGHTYFGITIHGNKKTKDAGSLYVFEYLSSSDEFVYVGKVPQTSTISFEQGLHVHTTTGSEVWFSERANGKFHRCNISDIVKLNTLVAHVKIPTLSSTEDTDIYMYYGNPGATIQEDPADVWNANYRGVWHLSRNEDSTSLSSWLEDVTGTKGYNYALDGKIRKALNAGDGWNSHNVAVPSIVAGLQITDNLTLDFWVYPIALGYKDLLVMGAEGETLATNVLWHIYIHNASPYKKLRIVHEYGDGLNVDTVFTTTNNILDTGKWIHITITRDVSSRTYELYIDGIHEETFGPWAEGHDPAGGTDGKLHIAGKFNDTYVFNGKCDELRILASEEDRSWVSTTHNFQDNPEACIAVGHEETDITDLVSGPIEASYTAKLGGVSLWIPKLSAQNFTITYEENDITRFSFALQNCDVNRTAIIDHLTDDFIIYRGTTPILTSVIDCNQIEYVSIDQIKVGGFSKWIELGYLIYKRMADADAESADAVFIRDYPSSWTDRTTAAGNDTINDVSITFNGIGDGIYIGDNDRFNSIKVKYSTKGIQSGTPTFNVHYSKGSGVWATLDCVDESREFTNDPGTYFIVMPTMPSDWSKDTVNSSSKYWIRIVLVTGSYSTNPKLDRIWISQTDVCRVQFDNTSANTILDLVLTDTGYSVDGTDQCPSTVIPSIRGEYESKLHWVAGIINALTWEDGNGDAQPYAWWIDDSKKVHVKQVRGSSYGDITAELTVLGNRLNYFEIANRIFGLGGGTGINQYHAIVENRSAQDTLGEIRETTYNDSRIFDHTLLKGQSGKLLTQSKTAKAQVKCIMPTYNWFEEGYEIGDRIKLHQSKWGIPDETEYAIRRVDISLDNVAFDVGIGREHLDNLQGNIQQQMNIQDVYMQGETSTFQVGPVEANYQRVDDTTVYPVKMVIEIPSNTTAINKALISWTLGGYQADVTGTETGGGHAHDPASPNTGLAGGHAHGNWAGLGGSGTPTGVGHTHQHQVNGSLTIEFGELYINSASNCGDNKSTVYGGNHHHTNPLTTLANQGHTHGLPAWTGAYDDDDELVANGWSTGTACASGYCVTGIDGVNVPSTTHYHHLGGSTDGVSQGHRHSQDATGDTSPSMYIEIDTTSVVFTVHPYVFGELSLVEDPVHGLTIDTVSDHNNHGIDSLADFTHTVPGTDTEPDFSLNLNYGIIIVAAGTIMELIVNDVTVGSNYDGDMTDLNIRGYLQNGNNNVILQPAVGQNHKGSAQLDAELKVFMDTE